MAPPQPQQIRIEPARREDAARVHALLQRLAASIGKPGGILGTVADIERFGFGEAPRFAALLAWRDAEPVGLALFFPDYSSWRGRPGMYVQDLFVAPECRGMGLGDALLAEVARCSKASGGAYVRLSVDRTNAAARRYYARAGFRHAEEECMLVADGAAFTALAGKGTADAADEPADGARAVLDARDGDC